MTEEQLPVWQTFKFWLAVLAVIALVALGQTDMAKQLFESELAEQVETHEPEKPEVKIVPKADAKEEGDSDGATG